MEETMIRNHREEGQVLLITLLVLTVATTIALSLIGRATLDFSISNQLEESTRAFSAAEAGVEQALKSGQGTNGPKVLTSGVTYSVNVNSIGGASGIYQLSHKTSKDVTETIWLAKHTDATTIDETPYYTSNTITMCWSQGDNPPGLVIGVLYKDVGGYKLAKVAYDPIAVARGDNLDGTGISTNGCGQSMYSKVLDFTALGITPASDTLIALRIRPVYADTTIAIDGLGAGIPQQGNVIESTGQTGSGVTRKVVVYQQYRAPLSVFDSVIYSQSGFGR